MNDRNPQEVSSIGNIVLSLHHKSNEMGINKLKVVLTEEAQAFLEAKRLHLPT